MSVSRVPNSRAVGQWRLFIFGHSLVSIAFASILIFLNGGQLFTRLAPLGIVAALYIAVNGIYYLLWKHRHIAFLGIFALCLEIALNTVLIFVLGPTGWVFAFAYLWPIVMGGWLISPRAVLPLTLFATLGYVAVFVSDLLGYAPTSELTTRGGMPQALVLALPQLAFVAMLLSQFIDGYAKNQRDLENERNLFGSVLHNMSDAVAVSREERYIMHNKAAIRLLGAHVGEEVATWLYPPSPPVTESIRDGYRIIKHGKVAIGLCATDLDVGTVWVARDTTEQERYMQLQSDFLAFASHELRTPLTTIKLHLRMLEMDVQDEAPAKSIQAIKKEIARETALVTDLLDMARIEAKKYEPHISSTNPNQLCNQLVTRFGPLATEKGLELVLSLGDQDPKMRSDPSGIERILCNLLSNAIKFTDHGCVALSCTSDNDSVEFSVSDTGCGLDSDQVAHLFEKYYTAGKPGGTGLGLVIARSTAQALGGTLSVASTPGCGTHFLLRLPIQIQDSGQSATP